MDQLQQTCLHPLCFHSSMSLREISENVKLAREYALLGNYSSASVLYHGLLEQIKKYVYTVRDSSTQQRWQQVKMDCQITSAQTFCVFLTSASVFLFYFFYYFLAVA